MKIILSVDFSNPKFNNDFALSNVLLQEHTILMVTNQQQLDDAVKDYDLVLFGRSSKELNARCKVLDARNLSDQAIISKLSTL